MKKNGEDAGTPSAIVKWFYSARHYADIIPDCNVVLVLPVPSAFFFVVKM